MEADIKQQKVHNQETIQALLLVYNRPSLTSTSRNNWSDIVNCMSLELIFDKLSLLYGNAAYC